MDYIKDFDNTVTNFTDKYMRNQTAVYGVIFLFLMLYSSRIAPVLPNYINNLFTNQYFKLVAIVLILWVAHVSPVLSILIAILFLMVTNYANNKSIWEKLTNEQINSAKKKAMNLKNTKKPKKWFNHADDTLSPYVDPRYMYDPRYNVLPTRPINIGDRRV